MQNVTVFRRNAVQDSRENVRRCVASLVLEPCHLLSSKRIIWKRFKHGMGCLDSHAASTSNTGQVALLLNVIAVAF